jgi:hypothetical protein
MAVYEGARPRSSFVPRRRLEAPLLRPQAPALPRRRSRVAMRATRRPRRVALAIGAIVVVFLLSFFSLVQTMRVSASGFDMARLTDQYVELQNQRRQATSDIDRLGRQSAVRREAISDGLTQLPAPVVIPAR